MKKTILAIAALALALTGCQKDSEGSESFSKASIVVEVTNYAGTGAVTGDFWNYVSFNIAGLDFNGSSVSGALNSGKTSFSFTTQNKPTEDKSYFASIKVTPVLSGNVPETMTVDYSVKVYGVIYDSKGNELRRSTCTDINATGTCKGSVFTNTFNKVLTSSTLELCYVKGYTSGEWMYNFGIDTWDD